MSQTRLSPFWIGVFFLVVQGAHAAPSRTEVDRLERTVRAAWENPARRLEFFDAFDRLSQVYDAEHRRQEKAWLLFAIDDEDAGLAVENELKTELATDRVLKRSRLSAGVERVWLRGGVEGVVRTYDRALLAPGQRTFESGAAVYDSRIFEVVVYQISRALNFNLVPVSTTRELDGHLVVIQAYVHDAEPGVRDYTVHPYDDEQMHVLDYLTAQADRHGGNHGVRPGGLRVLWDDDAVFDSPKAVRTRAGLREAGQPEPRAMRPPTRLTSVTHDAVRRLGARVRAEADFLPLLSGANRNTLLEKIDVLLALPITCEPILG